MSIKIIISIGTDFYQRNFHFQEIEFYVIYKKDFFIKINIFFL